MNRHPGPPESHRDGLTTVRSLVFADVVHAAGEPAERKDGLKTGGRGDDPRLLKRGAEGFEVLRRAGVDPDPALVATTGEVFGQIGDGLSAESGRRLRETVAVLENGFADIGRLLMPGAGGTGAMIAYGFYQGSADEAVTRRIEAGKARDLLERRDKAFRALVDFLLFEKWFEGRSLLDMLKDYWGGDPGFEDVGVDLEPLGFPDGYYLASASGACDLLFEPGRPADRSVRSLLGLLPELPAKCDVKLGSWQLVSWDRLDNLPLFRSGPGMLIDAGMPILGLAEVLIHELTHHAFHRSGGADFRSAEDKVIWKNCPVLNEGFAEYHTARVFEPVAARFPALDRWRRLRHMVLRSSDPDDAHIAGAELFEKAVAAGADPRDPEGVAGSNAVTAVRLENAYATPEILFGTGTGTGTGYPANCTIRSVTVPTLEALEGIGKEMTGCAGPRRSAKPLRLAGC